MEVDEPQAITACLTYTLAFRFIFKVLDLSSSACRSGKEVASQYSEVTISWQVSTGVYLSASSITPSLLKLGVLLDSDWSFWVAVGKLFQQQWVQWVVGQLYLSLLIHAIPIPIQISRLKSLISSILKEPFLQRMCDSQLAHLSESLIHRPDIEDCNRDYPTESPQIEGFPRSLGRLYGGF
ncbi:hypothetical protein Aperf_G00000014240 [Anoplocephala perfoliata]